MPRTGQIIPGYLHPHVETYINDNTEFMEAVSAPAEGLRFINVFTSGKGRDGVILPFDTTTGYTEEYGNPNYKLYGQPGYMPYAALSSGQAKCWCMRVMPDDAAYSNVVVLAQVKVDSTDAANKKLNIKHKALFHNGLLSKDEFAALTDLMTEEDPDVDGYVTFPLFGVYSLGRGVYGDVFRIRMGAAPQEDKDNAYKNYILEVLTSEGGIKRKELFSGTLFADAVEANKTLFLEDLVNDVDSGSTKLGMYVNQEALGKIFEMYKTVDPTTTITIETFDPITGKNKLGVANPKIVFKNTETGAVSLDRVEGVPLSGGTDGSFAVGTATPEARETAINAAYVKAFNGEFDRAILSKRRTPAELILDANYEDTVKRALIGLLLKRYDAYGFIDGGILNTTTDAIAWAENMSGLGDRAFSKDCQHYMIRDPFSGKNIPMTTTYYYALQLPVHFRVSGNHIPFVGERVASLTGMVKNSLKPMIDADDVEVKEKLYELKVNYFECVSEGTYVRGTQGTSQLIWSDLSEENNMHVLLEMKRKLETLVGSLTYNFADPEDRQRFTETADRMFSDYKGTKVRTASVYFDMNPWETERSILHCYLAVTYRTLSKRGIIEIDINKRV